MPAVEDAPRSALELVDELDPLPGNDENGTKNLISRSDRTFRENIVSSPDVLRFFVVSVGI